MLRRRKSILDNRDSPFSIILREIASLWSFGVRLYVSRVFNEEKPCEERE